MIANCLICNMGGMIFAVLRLSCLQHDLDSDGYPSCGTWFSDKTSTSTSYSKTRRKPRPKATPNVKEETLSVHLPTPRTTGPGRLRGTMQVNGMLG
jgi:hypothetical protein